MALSQWLRACGARRVAPRTARRTHALGTRLLALEERVVPAVYRSYDGTGNNLANPGWGATSTDLIRVGPAEYADGISTPGGAGLPSPRAISNSLAAHPAGDLKNSRDLSNFIYAWGQFIDHDLDQVLGASPRQSFNISVPTGDPQFDPASTGTQIIPFGRSNFDSATGTSASNPRQQVNSITAFLDGSMVYGSDTTRAAALRTFVGGQLKTSTGNLLPLNTAGLANDNDTHQFPADQLFLAGDSRANENVELTALQTLFVREHNRLAEAIGKGSPGLSDEEIYQRARRLVIGEIQAITYKEFLPALLGPNALTPYRGYNPKVNPGIANEFAGAAFRVGHSMLGNDVEFLNDQGEPVRDSLLLKDALFNPGVVKQTGIDPILKYLASDRSEEIDLKVVDSLRNFLFGAPGQGGLDLVALNIQRGRDHGLADYNATRVAYGLRPVTSFQQISSDPAVQQQLQSIYGNVNNIDLWVGGLAEDHLPGSSLGPTFSRIIADQFQRLRDGDRFWYQRDLSGADLASVESTTLSAVIQRNTTLRNLQLDVFLFKASIAGTVFGDGNRDGVMNSVERGIAGRTIQLLAADGSLIASTLTGPDGRYRFDGVSLGSYTVREILPTGATATTPRSRSVLFTRGGIVERIDFGELPPPAPPAPPPPPGGNRPNGMAKSNPTSSTFPVLLGVDLTAGPGGLRQL